MKKVLLLLALICVTSATYAQQVTYVTSMGRGVTGSTDCGTDGKPVVTILSGRSEEEMKLTYLHEMVHVRQILNFPGTCEDAKLRYQTDPLFRFNSETEAYCAELDSETNPDKREYRIDILSLFMFQRYGYPNISYVESKKIVHATCNQMRGGVNKP